MDARAPDDGPRRLILTITTGRSGTRYLARVLALFARVRARHEPRPRFGGAFRSVCREPAVAREFWTGGKLARIARARRPIYAETSHLACKGFLESLVELGRRPDLIHLVRAPRAVALSMLAIGAVPGRTLEGLRHFLAPDDPVHLPVAGPTWRAWHDYQLAYWSALEIEARAAHYRRTLEPLGLRVVRAELDELATRAGILALGRALDLGPLSLVGRLRLDAVAGRPLNHKPERRRPVALPEAELDELEAGVRDALGAARAPQSASKA